MKAIRFAAAATALAAAAAAATMPACAPRAPLAASTGSVSDPLPELFDYIRKGWTDLRRTHADLVSAAIDPKFPSPDGRWPVYLPPGEDREAILRRLAREIPPEELARIDVRSLPAPPAGAPPSLVDEVSLAGGPGLLWLPEPYVVPGGRFNEMYGWDSYFILVGLLRDGEVEAAQAMVDNFLYQVDRYGRVLNANRRYYLSRSQPPFLARMVRRVFERTGDRRWLASTVPALEKDHAYWVREPHATPETGLSRYYDLGQGPAPEVVADEKDERGRTHYDRVREAIRAAPYPGSERFYDRSQDRLTDAFYVSDRSMRESGFDPSDRFGRFNLEVVDVNPVCLNTLLHRYEEDVAAIYRELGQEAKAERWAGLAAARKVRIDRLLWDEASGLYLDYDLARKSRRDYPFATTFYPLWAGIASEVQARRVVAVALTLLEAPGGLKTSVRETGSQWDAPYGWAPLQLLAVEGMRRYGFSAEADRISQKFLSLVLKEFQEHHAIFEKYDVVRRESATSQGIRFGYASNEIGFGWTNAAFVELWAGLSPEGREAVRRGAAPAGAAGGRRGAAP